MNREEYLQFHSHLTEKMKKITAAKNADYTGAQDDNAFANFEIVSNLGITPEQGFITRMSDKLSRIASFVKKGNLQVKSESVEDTLLDLANYCLLMAGYLKAKDKWGEQTIKVENKLVTFDGANVTELQNRTYNLNESTDYAGYYGKN